MKKILYVNAGAGSGKTHKLTHLLPELMKDKGVDPSEVIVTTFTKAAAAEIKERAREVLLEQGEVDLATRLDTAAIGTIHAVAEMFIKKYWYAIGMAPDPELLNDTDKAIYTKSSIAHMLQNADYSREREAINKFYETFSPKTKVNNFSVDNPDFWTDYLEKMVGKIAYYDIDEQGLENSQKASKDEVGQVFNIKEALPTNDEYWDLRTSLLDYFQESNKEKPNDKKAKAIKSLKKLPRQYTYASLLTLLSNIKECKNEDLKHDCEQTINIWVQNEAFGQIVCNCIDALFTLANAWREEYERYKRNIGVIDYDDMEKYFLKLLNIDSIAQEIGKNYKLVMVDEFQDCNPIQLRIFDKLSELVGENSPLEQSSVWVGDPKQAIYSFRGSNTNLIERVANHFPEEKEVVDENGLKKKSLESSYRSRKEIIKLVNDTFDKEGLFKGMVRLTSKCKHCDKYINAIEHWQIKDDNKHNPDFRLNIARKVKEIVEEGNYYIVPKGETEPRKLEYKDIAILVRTNENAAELAKEMMCEQIPVSVPEQEITSRIEIQLLLALMELDEPTGRRKDHEWASVLHLWCGVPTEEVLRERINYMEMVDNEEISTPWLEDDSRLDGIKSALEEVKGMAFEKKLQNLILLLGLNDRVKEWGQAEVRKQNMVTLQNAATAFVNRCNRMQITPSIAEFKAYIKETKLDVKKDTDSDTVKVITYHGSKGLEWPMVILCSLNDKCTEDKNVKTKFIGVSECQIESSEDSLLPEYQLVVFPDIFSEHCPSGLIDKIKNNIPRFEQIRQSNISDAKRLLYVGMTRAREYLVSVGQGNVGSGLNWLNEIGIESNGLDIWNVDQEVKFTEIEAIEPKKPKETDKKYKADINRRKKNKTPEELAEDAIKEAAAKELFDKDTQEYERLLDMEAHRHEIPLGKYQLRNTAELKDDGFGQLINSPSKMVDDTIDGNFEINQLAGVHFFPENIGPEEYAHMGTCIHNVFAAFDPSLDDESNTKMAATAIGNHGFKDRIDPSKVINSAKSLYAWLTEKYGKATEVVHEVPFSHQRKDDSIVRGEMDLLWKTADGVVLIDFKNFVAQDSSAYASKTKMDNEKNEEVANPHYVGNYFPQINAYAEALKCNQENIVATLIYYSVIGDVVEIKFNA